MKHFFHKHLSYQVPEKLSVWRKISMNSWKPTGDSTIGVFEDFILDDIIHFCSSNNIGMNAVLIKSLSEAMQFHPRINSVVRYGRIYNRIDNGIFMHVLPYVQQDDLSGVVITNAHKRTVQEIHNELQFEIHKIHNGQDALNKTKKTICPLTYKRGRMADAYP